MLSSRLDISIVFVSPILTTRPLNDVQMINTAAALAKRAMNLTHVGGTYGGARRPTPFLCLLLKMLMIQPEMEIVETFISEKDFRYVRLLGVFYLRLVGKSAEIYRILETLYSDNRKFKIRNLDGSFSIEYIDEFIDQLLTTTRVCDTTLPPLAIRDILVEKGDLGKRVSLLDAELEESDDDENEPGRVSRLGDDSDEDIHCKRADSDDEELEYRGRRRERSPSPVPRSLSTKRVGFRSPSPQFRDDADEPEEASHRRSYREDSGREDSRNGSTTSPRRAQRSPDISSSSRGARSPDAAAMRHDVEDKPRSRSPDAPPSARRGQASPDVARSRRGERSPDVSDYRRRDRSPDIRNGGNRSPSYRPRGRSPSPRRDFDRYDRRRSPSPSARYVSPGRDDRDYRDKRDRTNDSYKDNSKKRSRYEEDEDDFAAKRRAPPDNRSPQASSSSSSKSKAPGKSGGKSGGLREMGVDEMNELRKSIGLGPLRS